MQTVFPDAEYRELIEFGFHQPNLVESARNIHPQIVSLDRYAVKDGLRPRAKMAAIPDGLSIEDMLPNSA